MVVNSVMDRSVRDHFLAPGALCGIVWMLFITGTTLSVPSLMGAIMAIGVATANSILLVNFANDERRADATKSARAGQRWPRVIPVCVPC